MTVTFPQSGTSARRWRRAAGRAAAIATALLLATPLAAGAGAAAAVDPAAAPVGVTMLATPLANGVVEPGDPLTVSVRVDNAGVASLAPGTAAVELGPTAFADRAALASWFGGDLTGVSLRRVATVASPVVAPSSQATFGIMVTGDDPALVGRAPGVYPLLVRYTVGGDELTSPTALIVPDATGDARVGVVVPITAGPLATGLLSAEELTALTAIGGALSDQLEAVEGTDAILAIDPAVPAAIRVLGTAAPAEATTWLERLLALPNSRFALQFGDADLSAQVQAGLTPLRPTSLQAYMDPANFLPVAPTPEPTPTEAPTPTPTPTATVSPTEPVYPDLATLLDIGDARAAVFWPVTATAGPDVVASFASRGTADDVSLTLVPSVTTSQGSAGQVVPARGLAGEAAVLTYDSAVSAALNRGAATEDLVPRGAALTTAAAMLALAASEAGDAPLLVTVDRGVDRTRVALRAAIEAAQLPGTRGVTLTGLANADPIDVTMAAVEPDAARVAAASRLSEGDAELAGFATILDDPTLITGPERASLLQVLGAGWLSLPAAWSTALEAHYAATSTTLGAVGIIPPSTIQLFSPEAPLPFTVRNDLAYPVNVVLFAIPDNLRLNVQRATTVRAGPASNTSVQVPVQARVGSGEVSIELRLRSPTGRAIGETATAEVVVRADWEGIGLTALGILVVGLLTVGLVRTVLRRRARAIASAAEEQSQSVETEPGESGGTSKPEDHA